MPDRAHTYAYRRHISEADAEKMVDRRLWRALASDNAYQNAESSEAAQEREDALGAEIWADIESRYIID